MGLVDTQDLIKKAHSLTRAEFVAKHPSLYLAIAKAGDQPAIGFETAVWSNYGGKIKAVGAKVDYELIEVAKAPGNPYPERISIGRARNCDVVLRDPSVSKLHAHFRVRPNGKLDLVDLDSQNGTSLNGRTLAANLPECIDVGDSIVFGALTAKLIDSDSLFDILQE